jgi:hypothetical protein
MNIVASSIKMGTPLVMVAQPIVCVWLQRLWLRHLSSPPRYVVASSIDVHTSLPLNIVLGHLADLKEAREVQSTC